jgi:hypothetical protein
MSIYGNAWVTCTIEDGGAYKWCYGVLRGAWRSGLGNSSSPFYASSEIHYHLQTKTPHKQSFGFYFLHISTSLVKKKNRG